MSFKHTWIAIKGLSQDEALSQLGLEIDRQLTWDEFPELGMGQLPDGWLLILALGPDAFEERFVELTRGRSGVACAEFESVMYSEARGYQDGVQTWSIIHDPEGRPPQRLTVSGTPPAPFDAIRTELTARDEAEQEPVDHIFDIAPRLAEAICGFRLGEPDPPGLIFSELRRALPARAPRREGPGLFTRLFGGRPRG